MATTVATPQMAYRECKGAKQIIYTYIGREREREREIHETQKNMRITKKQDLKMLTVAEIQESIFVSQEARARTCFQKN